MEVNQVEIVFFLKYILQLQDMRSQPVNAVRVEPQSLAADGKQGGSSHGIAARKQRDFVTSADQFFRQP
jgi:hypothetical protein